MLLNTESISLVLSAALLFGIVTTVFRFAYIVSKIGDEK